MRKIRVGILFGGKSAEHEVSLQSARNIVDALDQLDRIDKHGRWQPTRATASCCMPTPTIRRRSHCSAADTAWR